MQDSHGNRLFDDRGAAADAWRQRPETALDGVDSAYDAGLESGVMVHPATPLRLDAATHAHIETTSQAAAGAGVGGAIGAVLGAIAMAVLSVGTSIAIPGLGWVLSGAIAAALAGAGAGATVGGVIGALVGLAMKQERLHRVPAGASAHALADGQPAERWHDHPRRDTLH